MTLSREAAEERGWEIAAKGGAIPNCVFAAATSKHLINVDGPARDTAREAIAAILPAITAIENYGPCVEMLEECRRAILNLVQNCGAMSSDGDKAIHDALDLVAKLEASL